MVGETDGETFVDGLRRVAGSVVGAVFGFAIALSDAATPWVVLPLPSLSVFAATYYRPVSPAVSTFWRTTIFAVLYEFLGSLTTVALELRVLETFLGAVAALVVAFLVLPTHTRAALDRDVTTLLENVDAIVTESLGCLAGEPTMPLPGLRQRLLAAEQHVRNVVTASAPLRRSVGALEVGGVEDRLTAVWSLTHDARSLVAETRSAEAAGVSPAAQDWRVLRDRTSQNITALTPALSGRLPGPVDQDIGAYESIARAPSRQEQAVLREVARINQTLLVLLEDASPGAVGHSGHSDELAA